MAINSPIIAASSTVTRAEVKTVIVPTTSTIPPNGELKVVDGVLVALDQGPKREGQMIVYVDQSDPLNRIALMYVVIAEPVSEFLIWKRVSNWGVVTDPRTGLPKDSRTGFYSIFA